MNRSAAEFMRYLKARGEADRRGRRGRDGAGGPGRVLRNEIVTVTLW